MLYLEYQSVYSFVRIGSPAPPPFPQASVSPPPLEVAGGTNLHDWRESLAHCSPPKLWCMNAPRRSGLPTTPPHLSLLKEFKQRLSCRFFPSHAPRQNLPTLDDYQCSVTVSTIPYFQAVVFWKPECDLQNQLNEQQVFLSCVGSFSTF
jgi:hypothetical protein